MNKIQHAAWFAAGISLGIASTWFIATPQGRRTRRKMARMVDQSCADLQKTSNEMRKRGTELVESGKELVETGKELLENGKEFMRETGAEMGRRLRIAT